MVEPYPMKTKVDVGIDAKHVGTVVSGFIQ